VLITPGPGTAFVASCDGRVCGWTPALVTVPLDGTAWTVLARHGDELTARSHDGRESTQLVPAGNEGSPRSRPAYTGALGDEGRLRRPPVPLVAVPVLRAGF